MLNVFFVLPPSSSSCCIELLPINICTEPLDGTNPPRTSPVDFAWNEVASFDNTIETASKLTTLEIVISSVCSFPNTSEPVNWYVTSSNEFAENDDENWVAEIVYESIPFTVSTKLRGGLLLPLLIVIGVTKDAKFFLCALTVILCPLGFGERVVGSYINWFAFDVTISWGALSPSSNLNTVSNSSLSSKDAV